MRSKYKRRENKDKIDIIEKKPKMIKNNINHSSALDIKRTNDKKIENVIFERIKPIFSRYEKNNYLKEKLNEKPKKEEIINENEKVKITNNIRANKENQNKYKKLNINTSTNDKNIIKDNNINDVNFSKLMIIKQRNNNSYKYNKISNDMNNNAEIIKNNQYNKEYHKKNEAMKKEISEQNKDNNIKYIYRKEKQIKNINENDYRINNLNIKPKMTYLSSQTESSFKINYQNNNEQKILNKENNNMKRVSSLLDIKNKYSNTETKPKEKQTFKYLVHQASKSREISNSFQKYYETRQSKPLKETNESNINDNTLKSEENSISKYKYRNLSILKSFTSKNNDSTSSINSNTKDNYRYNSLTDRKMDNYINSNNLNNVKIINFKYNINTNENKIITNDQKINLEKKEITQNIINNNIYNTTLNFYKIDNIYKSSYYPKTRHFSSNNIMETDDIIYEDEINTNKIYNQISLNNIKNNIKNEFSIKNKNYKDFILASSSSSKTNIIPINLDNVLSLEKILKLLLEKINKFQTCENECLEFINYYFNNKFYNEEIKAFNSKHIQKIFLENEKIELLCFFLCYDVLLSNNFNQTAILFKTIFNLIQTNYLIFISFIINSSQININKYNQKNLENLQVVIEQDLKIKLRKRDMNEYNILQIINNNSKNLNNYYKMIIDNLYGQYNVNESNSIRFPQCLNNKNKTYFLYLSEEELLNIKSTFFFDAYRLLTNYNFDDLYDFFNLVLKKKRNIVNKQSLERNYNYNQVNRSQEKTKINIQTKFSKCLLPKINNKYKYSLVLDLDETLICIKRDNNKRIKIDQTNNLITLILRPGLFDFLQKMKKIYELIIFSLGTSEYVSPIIKQIEKNEQYFEHILYRDHVTYDDNGIVFKNLNLLNRDVKNIIIVDDNYNNFKFHKSNGICIKPFYGDTINDKNTLKILGNILFKIRYDADLTGDIRISLNKEKNSLLFSQIANKY